jgi:hypothetical protein
VSAGGVYIWIFDYGRLPANSVPARPARIQLGERRMHACGFGEGYSLDFEDHGDAIHIFVKLGPWTGVRGVLEVLNSLRVMS